ncbi:DUF7146 domain-containing protein [Mesorhizobium qingshengii]|uniref:Toprim domain-containing protein n=1 Tax=Mesorhizobium qingshengii TaxID=1165689 RepID=A0A1G5ZQH9_9HYPH|nr:toprim domain-containing protein [Mesorhizobium qingshengii]SDA96583.1 Toprim domain-containing protein [Mesorhizobium qingshengii]
MGSRGLASDLAWRLARDAEAVCRAYLSSGRRQGNYWVVGDVHNAPGRSMHVRLRGSESGKRAAGKWTDEATGEFGDLLDVIQHSCGLSAFRDVADEARRFLSLPRPAPSITQRDRPAASGSPSAAHRLFAMAKPLGGTLAEQYLRHRDIVLSARERALRFHPNCYYRDFATGEMVALPALIAAITDLDGLLTGVQRTWLEPDGYGKALVAAPRRSMGNVLGNGIRLGFEPGVAIPVMAAGEGLETMASLRTVFPTLPVVAATSANHLAATTFPPGCERLYIAADADAAGRHGIERLSRRAGEAGVVALVLRPQLGDFNEDLRRLGPNHLAAWLQEQFVPEDVRIHLPCA